MTLADAMQTVRRAEASLNRALADYEASSNADTREFSLLKVQLLIFYYDVLTGMVSVACNNPKGFARAVALKTLYHACMSMRSGCVKPCAADSALCG